MKTEPDVGKWADPKVGGYCESYVEKMRDICAGGWRNVGTVWVNGLVLSCRRHRLLGRRGWTFREGVDWRADYEPKSRASHLPRVTKNRSEVKGTFVSPEIRCNVANITPFH